MYFVIFGPEADPYKLYRCMLNSILESILGSRGYGENQRYFVAITCLIASIFLAFRAVMHLVMDLSTIHVLLVGMGSLFTIALFLLARFTTFNYQGMNTEGSGIGLSIVQKIVEFLGGSVWFSSVEGIGTTFFVSLPYTPANKMNGTSPKKEPAMKIEKEKRTGKYILVVEDEENSKILIMRMLKPIDMEIQVVSDGNEAIRHVIMNPDVSLILMDLKLPTVDGFEATRAIKKLNPKIPIIAQTAYAMMGDRQKALDAGCDDYLTKPISSSTLLSTVRSYL